MDGNKLDKWNGGGTTRLITLEGVSCNGTKATPNFSGDLLGDWREEVILHDDANLYLSTTTTATTHRLYTLAHDPVYRLAMSWQNGAYNQPPHPGFWLGAGVDKAPKPDIRLVGATSSSRPSRDASRQTGLTAFRSGSKVVLYVPWGEAGTIRFHGLDGRTLHSIEVAQGGAVEVEIPRMYGAMLIVQARSRAGRQASTTMVGF